MEVVSNRSDRDSNLPEYYQQPPKQQPGYQHTTNRQPSYQAYGPPKEPDQSTQSAAYTPTAYTAYASTAPSTAGDEKASRHRLPFGWTPLVFGVVTALVTAIVVGAAVGGGVGGAMSKSNSDCKSSATDAAAFGAATVTTTVFQASSTIATSTSPTTSTSSSLATDYSALGYSDISSLELDCPALDSKNYSSVWESQLFILNCDFLYNGGDIASVFVYSWQECVDACASVNHYIAQTQNAAAGSKCTHALFQAGLDGAVTDWHRNCWLKGTGAVVGTATAERKLLAADLYA